MIFFKFFLFLICTSNIFGNFLNEKTPSISEISKIPFQETQFQEMQFQDSKDRECEDVTLNAGFLGNIKFSISYPKKEKTNKNILILLNGLETGRNALRYFPHPPNYIIIGYEFPKELQKLRSKSALINFLSLRKAALSVPMQIICIEKWIEKQPWHSENKTAIVGLSFGSIFVPAIYHLAKNNDIQLGLCIMAFGGAGLYDIFYANIKVNKIIKAPLAYLTYLNFKPLDPVFHLPYIQGKFLIINGKEDENIPFKSAQTLQKLTPEPKTIINIDSKHMSVENKELINQISEISLKWLNENQITKK